MSNNVIDDDKKRSCYRTESFISNFQLQLDDNHIAESSIKNVIISNCKDKVT